MSLLPTALLPQFPGLPKPAFLSYMYVVCFFAYSNTPPDSYFQTETLLDEYDFIIVGSGSAGSIVANRLSAAGDVSVLMIEAGGAPDAMTEIPFLAPLLLWGKYDWKYETVPQRNSCLGLIEQRSRWIRGKVLGGSGTINAMLYVRGNKDDFDGWVTKYGATGWSYEEVLPYFKSIETFYVPKYANNGYHGHQGELPIGYAPSQSEASKAYLEGWRQLGYHSVDYNGPSQIGNVQSNNNSDDDDKYTKW